MLLPPGFRFHPTDVELIMYYLKRKVMGKKLLVEAISEVNIYKFPPSDLPDKSCLISKDLEWYFFCPRERKYASGARMNRATESGYWKTTGKDRPVHYNEEVVGMIKTLVFHLGHAPRGQRTDWVLYEYRIVDKQLAETGVAQDAYVLCKVFHKKGLGPQNGAQYGAPFKEEEWEDDDARNCIGTFPSGDSTAAAPSVGAPAVLHLPQNASSSVLTNMSGTENTLIGSVEESDPFSPGPSAGAPAVLHLPQNARNSVVTDMSGTESDPFSPGPSMNLATDVPTNVPTDMQDDIFHFLASFTEDAALTPNQNDNIERTENNNHERNIGIASFSDGNEAYNNGFGGENLGNWQAGGNEFSLPAFQEAGYVYSPMLFADSSYLELNDLEYPLNSSAENNECANVPTNNPSAMYNSYGDSEQSCFMAHPFGANQYFSGSSQLPLLPDGFDNLRGFSSMTQVNGDGTNANQGYAAAAAAAAAYNLSFTQPDESRGVDQNNFRSGFDNCFP